MPEDLRTRYKEGRLVPFIGAGASMSVAWADSGGNEKRGLSWSELVDHAAEELGFPDPDLLRVRGTDLQILEYYRIVKGSNDTSLQSWFASQAMAPDEALRTSGIHSALAALSSINLIYTTNFDDYIERALRLHGREAASIADEHQAAEYHKRSKASNVVQVIKFHGDLTRTNRMVLSERDYEHRIQLQDAEDHRLLADLMGKAALFIGYSFRDWNVSYLFRLIQERFGNLPISSSGRRGYIVVPEPSRFEYELFRARNLEVIAVSSTCLAQEVVELLEALK